MLTSYNFYNSLLLRKLINQFVRRGQKERIELVIFKFLLKFSRTRAFSAIWLLLTNIELHKPVITFKVTKYKNRIVHKPSHKTSQSVLLGIGLR
jgi:ribosomal protein S7